MCTAAIPYLGYVEVNLQIPGIWGYIEYVLMLVIPMTTYVKKVPVMVSPTINYMAMKMIRKGELARVLEMWRQAHFSAVMSWSLQLLHQWARRDGALAKGASPSAGSGTTPHMECHLDDRVTSAPLGRS